MLALPTLSATPPPQAVPLPLHRGGNEEAVTLYSCFTQAEAMVADKNLFVCCGAWMAAALALVVAELTVGIMIAITTGISIRVRYEIWFIVRSIRAVSHIP